MAEFQLHSDMDSDFSYERIVKVNVYIIRI